MKMCEPKVDGSGNATITLSAADFNKLVVNGKSDIVKLELPEMTQQDMKLPSHQNHNGDIREEENYSGKYLRDSLTAINGNEIHTKSNNGDDENDVTVTKGADDAIKPPEPDAVKGVRSGSGPPDGGWGWMVVLGSAVAFFLAGGASRSFTLIYQELLDIFQQSAAATSLTAAVFGSVKMCSSPIVSIMCSKFSKRSVAISGGVITCVALLLTSFPVSLPYLYFTYGVLAAFGFNMVLTPCFIIISEYFKKRRARAMSLAMLGGSLGGMSLPPLINFLFGEYSYSGTILILAGMSLNLCVAGALFRALKPMKRRKRRRTVLPISDEINEEQEISTCHEEADQNETELNLAKTEVQNTVNPGGKFSSDVMKVPCIVINDVTGIGNSTDCQEPDVGDTVQSENNIGSQIIVQDFHREDGESDDGIFLPAVTKTRSRQVSFQIDGDILPPEAIPGTPKKLRRTAAYKCSMFFQSMGLHLFKQTKFTFYSVLMMGSVLSLSIAGLFLSGLVHDLGLERSHTSLLLSASAGMDIPGKFASGFVFDLKKARPYRSFLLALLGFLTGLCSLIMGFSVGFMDLFMVYMLYTFFASAYHTQLATVLADIVGPANLSGGMGLCRLSQGIGFVLGPTIGGLIRDQTELYSYAYIFSGSVLMTFTLLYTSIDLWLLWKQKHEEVFDFELPEFPEGHEARYRHDSISTISL